MRSSIRKYIYYVAFAGLSILAVSVLSVAPVLPAFAAADGLSVVANKNVAMNTPAIINDLQITGTGNDNVTIMIQSEEGEFSLDDAGITANGVGTNQLTLSGTMNDVNVSLSTLTYLSSGRGTSTIRVSLGSNVNVADVIIDPNSGRAYTIIDDELTWNDARNAALQLEYGGVQGYLANITSEEEDEFIVANLSGNGWIGANDYHEDGGEDNGEGDWRWVDGPEADTSFWTGNNLANGGEPVLGLGDVPLYNNWNLSEPNNSGDEDCAEYIVGEGWNDLSCSGEYRSYVVEFGAGVNVPDPVERTFTVTATPETQSISTCDQLFALTEDDVYKKIELTANIDCQGRTEAPLFDEADFYGIFEGNGFTIKNLVIANEWSSHVGLTGYSVGAEYRNLFLDNITVQGGFHNGVLAGHVEESMIAENIHATNISMTGVGDEDNEVTDMGVLFGTVQLEHEYGESRIEHVSVQGKFIINDVQYVENIGGLIGSVESESDLVIKQAYTDVDILINNVAYEKENIGGLIGYWYVDGENNNADKDMVQGIINSYSWGAINAPDGEYVGGLIGYVENDAEDDADMTFTIGNSYSWMDITASENIGGLIGYVNEIDYEEGGNYGYEVNNSFYAGALSGGETSGIIIGSYYDFEEEYSTLAFDNIWYDASKVEGYECVSNVPVDECNAANSDGSQPNYFMNNKTNAPIDQWDFATIWKTNANTPPVFKPFIGNDGDQDGANDYIEDRAPNGGDANNDGTPDSEQAYVASFVSSVSGKYVSIVVNEDCALTQASSAAEASGTDQDTQYNYLTGLLGFTAECGEDGYEATVTLYHYGVNKDGLVLRKYNPNTNQYFTITNASLAQQTIGGQSVAVAAYSVKDGGQLDIDDEENGTIVDPVGLATLSSNAGGSSAGNENDLASTGRSVVIIYVAAGLLIVVSLAIVSRKLYKNRKK